MTPTELARRLPFPVSPSDICRLAQRGEIPGAVKDPGRGKAGRWTIPPAAVGLVARRLAARAGQEGRG